VDFGNHIDLLFAMTFDPGQTLENVKMVMSYTSAKGALKQTEIPSSEFVYNSSINAYVARISSIDAMDFGAVVTAKIMQNSTLISDVQEYSIESYCENRLNNSSNEVFKTLVTALMKYGRSAEAYFRN
jgi:hypothetical protein